MEHIVFEFQGTRFDLVLTHDPYGGVLVIWPQGRQFWRYHAGDRLKPLMSCCPHDTQIIFNFLEASQ